MWLFVIAAFLNQNAWFTNAAITNSRILKSFFTLILKRATDAFTFFLYGASHFLFVYVLVYLSYASFIVFSYQCNFVSIRSFFFANDL